MDKQKGKRSALSSYELVAIDYAEAETAIETYSHRSKQWTRLDNICIDCKCYGAEIVDGKLIVIGGLDHNGIALKFVNTLNLSSIRLT